ETLVAKTETRTISRIFGKAPKPEKAAEVAPEPEVLPEAPVALPDIVADTEVDNPDARLIASNRAEADQEATARYKLEIDWERWKPRMQRGAAVAGLVVVVVFAWPRLAPTLSSLYSSLSNPAPAPAPVRPEPTPVVP